jgi:hypothetical protein
MSEEKKPSLREAARDRVEGKRQTEAPKPAAGPFQKVKPPVIGVEQVTVRCGHTVPFELFDLKKDKFRNDRRKKLTDRDCSACRIKAQEARQAAEREEARKRRQEKPKRDGPPAKPKKWRPQPNPSGRLPDGSRFDVAWNAAKEQWAGSLAVPGSASFTAAATGVFKLLQILDGLYRAALTEEPDGGADPSRDVGGEG